MNLDYLSLSLSPYIQLNTIPARHLQTGERTAVKKEECRKTYIRADTAEILRVNANHC